MIRFFVLITLPLLFFIPFFLSSSYVNETNKDGSKALSLSNIVPEAPGESLAALGLPDLLKTFDLKDDTHYVRYKADIDSPQPAMYFSDFDTKEDGVLYPIVVHLKSSEEEIYSASMIVQTEMRTRFPAFNLTVQMPPSELRKAQKPNTTLLMGLTMSIIKMTDTYPIDPTRIYIVGCDSAATHVLSAIKESPDFFRAGIMLSGGSDFNAKKTIGKTSLLMINGSANKKHSPLITKRIASNIKKQKGDIAYKEIPNLPHSCKEEVLYNNIWPWLFSKK